MNNSPERRGHRKLAGVRMTAPDNLPPIPPGQFLKKDLAALGMDAQQFARYIGVPSDDVIAIMDGYGSITAEMADRLARAFGSTSRYWLNLQAIYDAKRLKQ